jgi:hypothetical protein
MIGTTRSRVSFFMNKFRALGFIDYNGKIIVHQSLLDSVLHDKPEIAVGAAGDRGQDLISLDAIVYPFPSLKFPDNIPKSVKSREP